MTATIFYRVKGMFSSVDVEETVYRIETARDGKGIRKIINSMKEPCGIECRFDCENGDSYYVNRNGEDVSNGVYYVRHSYGAYSLSCVRSYEESKMSAKNLINMLEKAGKNES